MEVKGRRRQFFSILIIAMAIVMTTAACSSSGSEVSSDQLAVSSPDGSDVDGATFSLHGDWVIDIVDADGTIASHHEFKNALGPNGPWWIASYLSTAYTPGNWRIILGEFNSSAYSPCVDHNGTNSQCFLIEAPAAAEISTTALAANYSTNLTVTPPTQPNAAFVLNGTVTAGRDVQLSEVNTTLGNCSSATAPDDCVGTGGTGSHQITSANVLAENINVTAGQVILVTVTLTITP